MSLLLHQGTVRAIKRTMKPFIRTIFIWILSLSLTGLPVVALSQNVAGDIASLAQTEKNMASKDSDGTGMHCHESMAQNKASQNKTSQNKASPQISPISVAQTTVKATRISPHAMHMSSSAEQTSTHDCCCGDDCQCQHDMGCQSVGHFGASSAILQSILFISSPINSQLATESITLYHDCDTDSEVIPPIS